MKSIQFTDKELQEIKIAIHYQRSQLKRFVELREGIDRYDERMEILNSICNKMLNL